MASEIVLIVGAGKGMSAGLARLCAKEGMQVVLAARSTDKLAALAQECSAKVYPCDASDGASVDKLFADVERDLGAPDWVVYNASRRYGGGILELDRKEVEASYMSTAYGGFLVAQAAAKQMLARKSGAIFFTGSSAGTKFVPKNVPFAMGKAALRALALVLAQELSPSNIHVAYLPLMTGIATTWYKPGQDRPADSWIEPDAAAQTYLHIYRQHRSAWSFEVEMRPWAEAL